MFKTLLSTIFVFFVFAAPSLHADDEVFARQGDQVLTQAELDAAFARIPLDARLAFIRDGGRVDQMVHNLLRFKQIAADAERNGFNDDSLTQLRVKLVGEQELAEAWLQNVVENAPEVDYQTLAKEYYIGHPEEFQTQLSVDVSHILVKSDTRPEEDARAIADKLHDELVNDPSLFDQYISEYSEDPAVSSNKGRYSRVVRGQMVEAFEEKAFAMQENGEISEPVQTAYGFHIIRLNGRTPPSLMPYERVRTSLEQRIWKEQIEIYRRNYILRISDGPIELEEGAVEKMVKRHFGENLELAPGYYER